MTVKDNPYDVVFDIESTDIKNNGAIMEVAALRVHRSTRQIVGRYYASIPIPSNCNKNEFGEKHYQKVKDKCQNSLPPENVFPEFLDWMRGPRTYTPPRLLGFCIEDRDRPNLIKQLGAEKEWIANADVLDIAHEYAFKLYPNPNNNEGAMERSLKNVAMDLGVEVDKNRLHDPLYDCELCVKVLPLLEAKKVEKSNKKVNEAPKQQTLDLGEPAVADGDITQTLSGFTDMYAPAGIPGKKSPVQKTTKRESSRIVRPDSLSAAQEAFLIAHGTPKWKGGIGDFSLSCSCGKEMVVRINPKTDDPRDKFFWGCTGWPDCEGHFNLDGTVCKGDNHKLADEWTNNRKMIEDYLKVNEELVEEEMGQNLDMKEKILAKSQPKTPTAANS